MLLYIDFTKDPIRKVISAVTYGLDAPKTETLTPQAVHVDQTLHNEFAPYPHQAPVTA